MPITFTDTLTYSGVGKQLIDNLFKGTPVYLRFGRAYGAKGRYNGSIGVVKKILLKDGNSKPKAKTVDEVKAHLATRQYGKQLIFQVGFDGETKTINLDPWEV